MNAYAREACEQAVYCIKACDYPMAIACLQDALRTRPNGKVWSKLMFAIRELNKVLPATS